LPVAILPGDTDHTQYFVMGNTSRAILHEQYFTMGNVIAGSNSEGQCFTMGNT
jgi:hypothetical protein